MNGRTRRILLCLLVLVILTIPFVWSGSYSPESETPDEKPEIQDVIALPQGVRGSVNVSATVIDDVDVYGVWIEVVNPSSNPLGNFSMSFDTGSGRYFHNSTYEGTGTHTCTIWANDTSNNWNSASGSFLMEDSTPPTIQNVLVFPNLQKVGGAVNVSAIVTDDAAVAGVWIEIRDPSNNPLGNFSMSFDTGSGRYFHNSTYEGMGTHTCTMWANDTSNNWNAELRSFTVKDSIPLGWLHADGKYIKNGNGEKIFLRGAAFGDLSWRTMWAGDVGYRVDQLSNLTNGRANVIRVALTPNPKTTRPSEPYPWSATLIDPENNIWETEIHPEVYDEEVDEIVAAAARNNIYVMIEFHGGFCSPNNVPRYGGSCTGSTSYPSALALDPTPYISWHLHWINRYNDNPTVLGVELWNEPWDAAFGYGNRDLGRERFMNMEIQAVEAIDEANPKSLTIVASAPYASIMQEWIDNPLPYNVMYGWDTYYKHWSDYWKKEYAAGDWEGGYARTYEKLYKYNIGKAAVDAGLPVIACEFGWRGDEKLEPGWEHQMADFLSIISDWETHWYIWWWWDSTNMGLANTGYTSLRTYGEIWAQAL